jgi:small subunit ribosomal protein S11e
MSKKKNKISSNSILRNKNIKSNGENEAKNFKNVGFNIKTPTEAKNKSYVDKKCPFIGKLSIRGRIIRGRVVSNKMNRTIIVRRDYLHWVGKYKRFEKRHRNIPCHCSPCFRVQEGDFVTIGECRPLSKTIRFNVLRLDKQISKMQEKK